MSLSAPTAAVRRAIGGHEVVVIRGNASERAAALAFLAQDAEASHEQVIAIGVSTSAREAMRTLFHAFDHAMGRGKNPNPWLLTVDGIGRLVRGHTGNAVDSALALAISAADGARLRLAVAAGDDLGRVAPLTAFALRGAPKLTA